MYVFDPKTRKLDFSKLDEKEQEVMRRFPHIRKHYETYTLPTFKEKCIDTLCGIGFLLMCMAGTGVIVYTVLGCVKLVKWIVE